ncbi:hypothetical protein ONS95_014466 [Cadophora gregata]|uniref:uncharacterized protein n=1 Tax=Cadophora gregata TaxID=51156 RepID=UPI0026DA8F60|nr:uncharacterized protein ONS95_014466 [Cadophora gregata]KAK0112730.1 hypothetical protein ONS95_014466 [Cadophora gregata]KAK0124865.1 hypothetical protein ONS96_008744 [Cadophora gregata f. sp. sojae]
MPVTTRRAIKAKPKVPAKKTTSREQAVDEPSQSMLDPMKAAPAIFQSFETTTALTEGHCVIRKIEDGSYEIVNLNSASAELFGSKEVGRLVLADETGGRMRALEDVEKSWKDSELKIGQVLSSANLRIFRFLKLPLELRLTIYDLTVRANDKLHIGSWKYCAESILPGIQLRGTCRQIYEESSGIFWRNHFRIHDICRQLKPLLPKLTANIQEITWAWWGFKIKDANTLRSFQEFEKLTVFHLVLSKYCVYSPTRPGSSRQFLHQNEPAVAKFNKTSGFDNLMSMRGLETVTVENSTSDNCKIKPEDASDAEIRAFEAFVVKELTKSREPKVSSASSGTKEKKVEKKAKGATKKARKSQAETAATAT